MQEKKKGLRGALIVTLLIILGVALLRSSVYTIKENEFAVIRQLGKITDIKSEPGLNFKIPFIQSSQKISKEIFIYDIPESDVITKDKKSMVVDSFVLWRISDPAKYIKTLGGVKLRGEERIEAAVYNTIKNGISSLSQEEVIASRGETLTLIITNGSNSGVKEYGIEIVTAQIKTLSLPVDNQNAVYSRMISERENIAASYEAEGKAEAQKIKNQADKDIELILAEANKKAAIIEAEGEEEYMRILQDSYNSADKADFYEYIRGLDALKASLKNSENKTIILDKNSELVKILLGE